MTQTTTAGAVEQLAMLDRIREQHWPNFDNAVLAAIIATTEAAAKLAGWAHMVPPDGGSPTDEETQLAAHIETSLRRFDHLKGQP